jgi:hypothetical protein
MGKVYVHVMTFLFILGPVLFMHDKAHADPLQELQKNLPNRINGWTVEAEDRFFDPVTIFDYINGAGEIYRSYNMKNCLSRRFTATNGPAIILDIFDMGSSEEAFGVFTHAQEGEPLDVGQDALSRSGVLSFWKDRFFVSIYSEEETIEADIAVKDLGTTVASHIMSVGERPKILLRLPGEGRKPKSIRYFHDNDLLNYHFYVFDENVLNLGQETKAALAEYQAGEEGAWLLLVSYPNHEKAEKAIANVRRHYLKDPDAKEMVKLENGKWSTASLRGNLLVFILEADGRGFAESLLQKVK